MKRERERDEEEGELAEGCCSGEEWTNGWKKSGEDIGSLWSERRVWSSKSGEELKEESGLEKIFLEG